MGDDDIRLQDSQERQEDHYERPAAEHKDMSAVNSIIPEIEEVKPIIEKLEKEDRKTLVGAMISLSIKRSWIGPYPPPEVLKGYNECFEDGAKAIFDHGKSQTDHRMEMEKMVMRRELNQSGAGQVLGVIIALAFLGVSGYLIAQGHEVSGTILGSVDLVALVAVFVTGRANIKDQVKDKKEDAKEIMKMAEE